MVDPTSTPENTPESERLSNAVQAMQARNFRISGDVIAKAVADLPDAERSALKWLAGYARARNLGPAELGALLPKETGKGTYSYDSIYQALTGRRSADGASLAPLVRAIETFRRNVEGISKLGDSGFVETRLSGIIWGCCRRALAHNRISYVFGESQIGKSESFKEYTRRNNHGETVYVEAPSGGGIGDFFCELALAVGIPTQQKQAQLRRRIIDTFDDRMLLIVDEAQSFLSSRYGERGVHSLNFLKELWNRRRCGIVLSFTNEGRDLFLHGPHAKTLRQLWNRKIAPLQLPATPPADDLDKFALAYGLDPAPSEQVGIRIKYTDGEGASRTREYTDVPRRVQDHVIKTDGLGVWLSILQDASFIAKEQSRPLTWAAVLRAFTLSQAEPEWE